MTWERFLVRFVRLLFVFSLSLSLINESAQDLLEPTLALPFWILCFLEGSWLIGAVVVIWLGAKSLERIVLS